MPVIARTVLSLPPMLRMGMSLPLVSRAIVTDVGVASRRIGSLYGPVQSGRLS